MKEAAEEGLESLSEKHPSRKQIEEMLQWADMVQGSYETHEQTVAIPQRGACLTQVLFGLC